MLILHIMYIFAIQLFVYIYEKLIKKEVWLSEDAWIKQILPLQRAWKFALPFWIMEAMFAVVQTEYCGFR